MNNNLLERMHCVCTRKADLPPSVLSYECVTTPVNDRIDHPVGYEYKIHLEIGVNIQTKMLDERTVKEAKRHVARNIYGQYIDELRDWFYSSDAGLNLPEDQVMKLFEIIGSMEGR